MDYKIEYQLDNVFEKIVHRLPQLVHLMGIHNLPRGVCRFYIPNHLHRILVNTAFQNQNIQSFESMGEICGVQIVMGYEQSIIICAPEMLHNPKSPIFCIDQISLGGGFRIYDRVNDVEIERVSLIGIV